MLCSLATAAMPATAFMRLDSLIACQDSNIARKENEIATIRKKLDAAASLEQKYEINAELYRAYVDFQNDSAQQCMRRNIDIATLLGLDDKAKESTLNLMHVLSKTSSHQQ